MSDIEIPEIIKLRPDLTQLIENYGSKALELILWGCEKGIDFSEGELKKIDPNMAIENLELMIKKKFLENCGFSLEQWLTKFFPDQKNQKFKFFDDFVKNPPQWRKSQEGALCIKIAVLLHDLPDESADKENLKRKAVQNILDGKFDYNTLRILEIGIKNEADAETLIECCLEKEDKTTPTIQEITLKILKSIFIKTNTNLPEYFDDFVIKYCFSKNIFVCESLITNLVKLARKNMDITPIFDYLYYGIIRDYKITAHIDLLIKNLKKFSKLLKTEDEWKNKENTRWLMVPEIEPEHLTRMLKICKKLDKKRTISVEEYLETIKNTLNSNKKLSIRTIEILDLEYKAIQKIKKLKESYDKLVSIKKVQMQLAGKDREKKKKTKLSL